MRMVIQKKGQSVGEEFRVTKRESTDPLRKLVKQGYKLVVGTDCVQHVARGSQCDVGRCEKFSTGGRQSLRDG